MTPANPIDPEQFWLRRAGYGLLLGASIAVLEFAYYYPLVSTPEKLGAAALVCLLFNWGGEGVLLALTVAFFERREARRRLGARQLALAVAMGSVVGVLAWQAFALLVLRERLGIRLFPDHDTCLFNGRLLKANRIVMVEESDGRDSHGGTIPE